MCVCMCVCMRLYTPLASSTGDLLLCLLLHLMLGIHYYVCPDNEHQVPHVWRIVTRGRRLVTRGRRLVTRGRRLVTRGRRLVTRGRRLVTRARRLVAALGTAQIAVQIARIEHRRLVTRKYNF